MVKRKKSSLKLIYGVNYVNWIIIKYDKLFFDDVIKCFFLYYYNFLLIGS